MFPPHRFWWHESFLQWSKILQIQHQSEQEKKEKTTQVNKINHLNVNCSFLLSPPGPILSTDTFNFIFHVLEKKKISRGGWFLPNDNNSTFKIYPTSAFILKNWIWSLFDFFVSTKTRKLVYLFPYYALIFNFNFGPSPIFFVNKQFPVWLFLYTFPKYLLEI